MADTIFALASAFGRSGVAVIRVSGPSAVAGCIDICRVPDVGQVAYTKICAPDGRLLDRGIALRFSSPNSFTGEDVVELQVHGSPAIISSILKCLSDIKGFRHAEAGEFTRRALENGKLDITQAEGLADLLNAETEVQRQEAQRVFEGELYQRAMGWRKGLLDSLALLEATIDFSDEEIPDGLFEKVSTSIKDVYVSIDDLLNSSASSSQVRSGFDVAIIGPPNVGKSSLINALSGRDVAIVSDIPGTTRDIIEASFDLGGIPVNLFDTAGIRSSEDKIEQLGVARAIERAKAADLRLFLLEDKGSDLPIDQHHDDILVYTKGDVLLGERISSRTGKGLNDLKSKMVDVLQSRISPGAMMLRDRHIAGLQSVLDCLKRCEGFVDAEVASFEIRASLDYLAIVVGSVGVEDVLDEIFSQFCLGK